jgi:hypothetical protein
VLTAQRWRERAVVMTLLLRMNPYVRQRERERFDGVGERRKSTEGKR